MKKENFHNSQGKRRVMNIQKETASTLPVLKQKLYILDTNVILHDPHAIMHFEGASVGIPSIVLEELDTFKREGTDRGRNSREAIRTLDMLRGKGSLQEGVKLDNGGTLRVLFAAKDSPGFPFRLGEGDNEILLVALEMKSKGYQVKFVSKDLNARVKADALGIETEDYLKEHVTEEEFYQGWVRIKVPAVQLKDEFPADLETLVQANALEVNQFILAESNHNPFNYKIFRYLGNDTFKPVTVPHFRWPLQPRNAQQLMALDLLLDENIQFVTLFGPAGTGKTFLALLAGLHQTLVEDVYEKMLISRPVVPLGKDIGYLPGDVQEKLHSWMLPIYDNMEFIVHSTAMNQHVNEMEEGNWYGKDKKKRSVKKEKAGLMPLDELMHRGKISLEAITYMRGRSIPYQFILIDEAQNLTPHEVKTLVTRVGEGSKIILAGDPYQIDSPYLDFSSNGLVTASERFKGEKIFGSVYLEVSERSELSQLAQELL